MVFSKSNYNAERTMNMAKIGKFTLKKDVEGYTCNATGHWFPSLKDAQVFIEEFTDLLNKYVGEGKWDWVDGSTFEGWKVMYKGHLVGYFPIDTSLDGFINPLN